MSCSVMGRGKGVKRAWPGGLRGRPPAVVRLAVTALCLALLLGQADAHAWGRKAHRIIGAIAESHVDPATARGIRELAGDEGLAGIATWADEVRSTRPETAPWHYVNIRRERGTYEPERDCATPTAGDCVVAAIERFRARLADPSQTQAARAEALRFLTHFVGDLHQPLHCVGDFRGGNELRVIFFGKKELRSSREPWNLHAVWDHGLLERTRTSERAYLERLLAWIQRHPSGEFDRGTIEEWALESHRLGVAALGDLPEDRRLTAPYLRRTLPVIEVQLARAGVRLARLLREAFAAASRASAAGEVGGGR